MSHKYSLTSFGKTVLTVTSLSVIAAVSVPSQVFSLTTERANLQDKTLEEQGRKNNSLTNLLNGETSNFLISKKDDNKRNNRRENDENDDYKNHPRRDNDHDNYRNSGYGKEENYRSSKSYQIKDWNCLFKVGKLVKSNKRALILQLDILEKPDTKYANVVHTVYARQNNRWVQFYSTNGAKLIDKKSGKYFLNPEIIPLENLQRGNIDLSEIRPKNCHRNSL